MNAKLKGGFAPPPRVMFELIEAPRMATGRRGHASPSYAHRWLHRVYAWQELTKAPQSILLKVTDSRLIRGAGDWV